LILSIEAMNGSHLLSVAVNHEQFSIPAAGHSLTAFDSA
jgi:hypothetical protein